MALHLNHLTYVPVIKWKRGEQKALGQLDASVKRGVVPLIEIVNTTNNSSAQQLVDEWGAAPAFIDIGLLDAEERMPSGQHPLEWMLSSCRERGANPIPVTALDRDEAHQRALADSKTADSDVGLRVSLDDFADDKFEENAAQALAASGFDISDAHLIVDLQAVHLDQIRSLRTAIRSSINALSRPHEWRSIVVVGTAFPQDLSEISPGTGSIDRAEYQLWNSLVLGERPPSRLPAFGDYTSSHFQQVDGDPRLMSPSASIRYTIDSEWLVFRGHAVRGPWARQHGGFDQFFALSSQVAAHPSYLGPRYSWGDDYIAQCAARTVTCGNLTTWRQVAVNHHITFAQRQVSSLV